MRSSPLLTSLARSRVALGLTQQELATRLGISRHYVQSMELGRCNISPRMAAAIHAALPAMDDLEQIIEDRVAAYRKRLRKQFGLSEKS